MILELTKEIASFQMFIYTWLSVIMFMISHQEWQRYRQDKKRIQKECERIQHIHFGMSMVTLFMAINYAVAASIAYFVDPRLIVVLSFIDILTVTTVVLYFGRHVIYENKKDRKRYK